MPINRDDEGRPWTTSGGGPVVVVPAELAARWRGTSPPPDAAVPPGWTWGMADGPVCDYDRACDPPQPHGTPYGGFAWVAVGDGHALILDAELATVFVADAAGGVIARGGSGEIPAALAAVAWRALAPAAITLTDGRLFMFDAAFPGAADPAAIAAHDGVGVIALGPGTYTVEVATTADETDLVRFRRR